MLNKIKRGNTFQEVNDSLNIVDVATRLGATNLTKRGNSFVGICPGPHGSQSGTSFHIDSQRDLYHCFSCKKVKGKGSILLVQQVKGCDAVEAVKWLVKEFNLKIDYQQTLNIPKQTLKKKQDHDELIARSFLLSEIVEIGKGLLFQEEGKEALNYLEKQRKYDPEVIKNSDWFYLPEDYDIKKMLIDRDQDKAKDIAKLKLQGHFGDNFRLAFPYRNAEGLITGLLKRSTEPKGAKITTYDKKIYENIRWDSTPGLKKDDLFGIDKVDKKEDTLIVVEGYPDVLYLQALGIKNVVAVGQGMLGKKHLSELKSRNIKHVIIVFDNDDVGPSNSKDAVELILKNTSITPYLIDPKSYGNGVKDPDEYLIKHGFEMLKNLFQTKAEDGAVWAVKEQIRGYSEANPLEKKEIKEKVLAFLSLVKDESSVSEILETLKTTFSNSIASLKKELKSRRKDYNDLLPDHITNDPIIPFNDDNSNTKCYYNAESDILNLGMDKEFIKELMLDYGLTAPENYPTFTVKFDPQDLGDKFNLRSKTFNLFTPTEYMFLEKSNKVVDLAKDCPAINTVVSNVVPDKNERDYFLNWLSFTFSTRKKSIVAWLLRGAQGTGKNLMFEEIITPLWGENHCSIVGNSALDSQFNPHMKHKMMIAYNEVTTDYRRDKKDKESKIKTYVSDSTVNINEKNVRQYTLANHSNSFFFSNYEVPIIIEDGDRRFNVVENNKKLEEHPYYLNFKTHTEFLNAVHNELHSFAQYLINYNYDEIKANRVFMNDAKQRIVGSSMGIFEEFAKKLVAKDYEWLREESGVWYDRNWDLECVKNGYIVKGDAVYVFNKLYGKNLTSPNVLSKQLKHYGIDTEARVTVGNSRPKVYKW